MRIQTDSFLTLSQEESDPESHQEPYEQPSKSKGRKESEKENGSPHRRSPPARSGIEPEAGLSSGQEEGPDIQFP